MDLLAGYGSDADSDQEEAQPSPPQRGHDRGPPTGGAAAAPRPAPAIADPSPANLLAKLPAPASSSVPLFSGLPKSKPAPKKVVVQFRVPITYGDAPAAAGGDDEAPAKKKQRVSTKGKSLAEFLPPPKHVGPRGGSMRLDAGTGGLLGSGAAARPLGGGRGRQYDSDDDEIVPGTEDRTGMELGPGDANEPEDNEAYRVDSHAAAAAAGDQYGGAYQEAAQQQYGGDYYASYAYQQQQQQQQSAAPPAAGDPAEALLAAALEEERRKASRRGGADPLAAMAGVQFKEINADALRYVDPSQRATMNSVRSALGSDYEARLRTEAGPAPGKLAKRKHQIGSLFAHAKAKELEDFERRAAGMKTKAETQSKYGW